MKKYLNIVVLLSMITSLTSCLKDKYNALNPDNSPSVIEFKNPTTISSLSPTTAPYSLYSAAFVAGPSVPVTYRIQLSGAKPAAQDITVTIAAKPAALATFNTWLRDRQVSTQFKEIDATLFSLPQTTYIIPAGKQYVDIVVNYKLDQFNYSLRYALALAITSTSFGNVSGNFGTILLNVSPKNVYDGVYSYDGTINRYVNGVPDPALSGSFTGGPARSITTIDATSAFIVPLWANGTGIAGIDNTYLTVDPATNLVTMACSTNATLKNTVGAVNKYDPATKTFTLGFEWGTGLNTRVTTMTLKYTGPTP